MATIAHPECLHCKELFRPHCRNRHHQKFCSEPACRKASKAESQRRWLSKPENRDHFRDPENVDRVRKWRAKHPGYWKREPKVRGTLQDLLIPQPVEHQEVESKTSCLPLQDLLAAQDPLVLGLIAHLIDSPLQDLIEQTARELLRRGRTFLDARSGMKSTENHENQKTHPMSRATPADSRAVQLDRPTRGP